MQGLPISTLSILPSRLLSSWPCDVTAHIAGEMSGLAGALVGDTLARPISAAPTPGRSPFSAALFSGWRTNLLCIPSRLPWPPLPCLLWRLVSLLCSAGWHPSGLVFRSFFNTLHQPYPHSLPFLSKSPKMASSSHIVELRRESCRYKTRREETSTRWRCPASCVHPGKWSIPVSVLPVVRGSPLCHSLFPPHPSQPDHTAQVSITFSSRFP